MKVKVDRAMPRAKQNGDVVAVVKKRSRTKPYQHTEEREQAAQLLAEDRLTDQQIAEKLSIGRATLSEWKRVPEFAQRVNEVVAIHANRALNFGLARKERRLRVLNELHDGILQVIDERGADQELAAIPGGKTGLVVKNLKGIGKGEDFQIVETYEIDTGAIKELRAIQEQVVKELGGKFGSGAGEVIPPSNATQVNVNVGTQIKEEIKQEGEAQKALPINSAPSLYDRLREVYGLSSEYISRRVSVTVHTEEIRTSSGDTSARAGEESTSAVPVSG